MRAETGGPPVIAALEPDQAAGEKRAASLTAMSIMSCDSKQASIVSAEL